MKHDIRLTVNGDTYCLAVDPWRTLNEVLREDLNLTGTKLGCGSGDCGACTILIDGIPRYACMTLAVEAEGHEITTVEGLMDGEELDAAPVLAATGADATGTPIEEFAEESEQPPWHEAGHWQPPP